MKKFLMTIIFVLIIIFIVLIYSRFIGVKGLDTNEIVINASVSESYDGLKIVHFSDLHYKKVITEKRVKELVKEINKIDADIVIFTGDLIDNDYSNEEVIKNIYIQSNFTLLRNEDTVIYNEDNKKIYIGGIDSYTKGNAYVNKLEDIDDVLYKIILVHEPDYIDNIIKSKPNTNLILSGHSINGSINILGIKKLLLPKYAKKYYKPYYKVNNTDIYISNGIGVNDVNFRLFNTPSINFYRFNSK